MFDAMQELEEQEEQEDAPDVNHYIVTVNRPDGLEAIDIWADEVKVDYGRLYFYRVAPGQPGFLGRVPSPKRIVVAAFAQWESFLLETDNVYGGIDPRDIPR
jgi:hypothetical protein